MEPTQQTYTQDTLFEFEDLAVKTTTSIERLEEQLKTAKQMLKDGYKANQTYIEQEGHVSAEKQMLKDIKQEVDQQPEFKAMIASVQDLTKEIKEKKISVSDYAIEYQRMSGTNQIQRADGLYIIQTVAKLIRKRQ